MTIRSNYIVMLLSIGFIASSIGCVVFAYLWIDRSISLSYMKASADADLLAFRRVCLLLENEWLGMTKKELIDKLKKISDRYPEEKIVIDSNTNNDAIWFDEVKFQFEHGKLRKIN